MSQHTTDDGDTSLHLYLSQKNIEKIGKKLKVESYVDKKVEQMQKNFISKNELLLMIQKLVEACNVSPTQIDMQSGMQSGMQQDMQPIPSDLPQNVSTNITSDTQIDTQPESPADTQVAVNPDVQPEAPVETQVNVNPDVQPNAQLETPLEVPQAVDTQPDEQVDVQEDDTAQEDEQVATPVDETTQEPTVDIECEQNSDVTATDSSVNVVAPDAVDETSNDKCKVVLIQTKTPDKKMTNKLIIHGIKVIPPNEPKTSDETRQYRPAFSEFTVKTDSKKLSFHQKACPPSIKRSKHLVKPKTLDDVIDAMDKSLDPHLDIRSATTNSVLSVPRRIEQPVQPRKFQIPQMPTTAVVSAINTAISSINNTATQIATPVASAVDTTVSSVGQLAIPVVSTVSTANQLSDECKKILDENIQKIQSLDPKTLPHLLLKLMSEKATNWGNDCASDLIVKSQDEYVLLQKYRNANPSHAKLLKELSKDKKKGTFNFLHKKK